MPRVGRAAVPGAIIYAATECGATHCGQRRPHYPGN